MKTNSDNYPSPAVAWSTVGILSLTYMFSVMDRQILVLLIDPIKADLNISDTEVSLLTGFAFALIYALAGVPMGRAADSCVRKYIIILGVSVWSILTMACGFARNFTHIFLARMGVGLGEAALTPTAYSMVADLFPPKRLAKGMSVFSVGGALGSGMSLILGGVVIGWATDLGTISLPLLGDLRPWQLVLITVGAASLAMVIPLSLIREPKRHESKELVSRSRETAEPTNKIPFKDVLKYMWDHRSFYIPFITGVSLSVLFIYGFLGWIPTYFIRVHEWDANRVGITLGAVSMAPAIVGSFLGGWLADHFYGKGYRAAPLYLLISVLLLETLIVPLIIYAPAMPLQLASYVAFITIATIPGVVFPTVLQLATHNRIRAQVSAIYLLISNIIGIGLGPTVIAVTTDTVFRNEMAVGHSIVITSIWTSVLAAVIFSAAIVPYKKKIVSLASDNERERDANLSISSSAMQSS